MHRQDAYSKGAELENLSRRELANGLEKDSIYKLRLQCLSRGPTGILGLARAFRVMDKDGSKVLSLEEFKKGILDMHIDINEADIEDMFYRFDNDGNGTINMTEFLLKLRPPMSESRLNVIHRAFDKLDANGDGQITITDFKRCYSVRDHPLYKSGQMSEDEIILEFLKNFQAGVSDPDGVVNKEEFENYYASISASIDNDTYFDLVLRQAYKL